MSAKKTDSYDNLIGYTKMAIPQRLAGEKLISLAGIRHDDVVLDAGCGPGTLTMKIAEKANRVTGIDASGKRILEARKNALDYKNLYFEKALLQDFCSDDQFTLVFSNSVMHWISKIDQKRTLDNFYDLLKPGGRINLQLIGGNPYRGLFHTIFRTFSKKYYRYYSSWTPPWFYPRNIATYKKIVEESSFTKVRAWIEHEKYVHTVDESMNFFRSGPLIGYTDTKFFRYNFKDCEYENLVEQINDYFKKNLDGLANKNGYVEYIYRRLFVAAEKSPR